ncbi:MAG: oligosaccharide flippase family protein [Nitrospira sp.]|nr:oligosaccharide flippase family protein [Nitrospira sp.]
MQIKWSGIKVLSQQAALVFTGKMTGACLGFVMSLLVARWMGPEEFGLFSLFIVILIFGNDVLGDGLSPGVVRFYSMYRPADPSKAAEVLTNALALRILLGIPVVVVGVTVGASCAERVFHSHAYVLPVVLGLVGSFGAALWSFNLSVWQAREEFGTYGVMMALVNTLRVLSLPVLSLGGYLTLGGIMGSHVVVYFLCALSGMWALRGHLAQVRINGALLRELFRFSKWPAMASLCFLLQVNLGVPVLSYFADAREAGLYGAGSSLLMGVDFLTLSLLTALLPKVSRLSGIEQCRSYVQRSFPAYALIAVALFPLLFFARPLVLGLFGSAYEGTIDVFQILFVGTLGTLVTHPLYLVLYTMNRPYLHTLSGIVGLVAWVLTAVWLIPQFGAVGAAWTTLCSRLVQSLMIVGILWHVLGLGRSSGLAARSVMPDVRGS